LNPASIGYPALADGITPDDINQGLLGDCWLLGGFACLARSCPDLIKQRFVSPISDSGEPVISRSGCYVIQLWDMVKEEWLDIVIDDR
jgi:calpain-11